MITTEDAKKIGDKLNINYSIVSLDTFKYALEVELEHGSRFPESNVTYDNLEMTGKIALAHLIEFPDYYQRLKKMEDEAEKYWSDKTKPSPMNKKMKMSYICIILLVLIIITIFIYLIRYTKIKLNLRLPEKTWLF